MILACGLLTVGCKRAPSEPSLASSQPSSAPAPSMANSEGTETPAGTPAGDILNARPDLLLDVRHNRNWLFKKVQDGTASELDIQNCPELFKLKNSGSLDQNKEQLIRETCNKRVEEELVTARSLLKEVHQCPFFERFRASLEDIDVASGVFPVWTVMYQDGGESYLTRSGRKGQAIVGPWLLEWPGAAPFGQSDAFVDGRKYLPAEVQLSTAPVCDGPLINVVPVLSSLYVELTLPQPAAGSFATARANLGILPRDFVDVALLVTDQEKEKAPLACGSEIERRPARALAWRVRSENPNDDSDEKAVFAPWVSLRNWNAPASCDAARRLLKTAPVKR